MKLRDLLEEEKIADMPVTESRAAEWALWAVAALLGGFLLYSHADRGRVVPVPLVQKSP